MFRLKTSPVRTAVVAGGLAVLAGCVTPPPPPPPPPPPIKVIPPRPVPPMGAAELMSVPVVDQYGVRRTPNYRLTSAQTTWNLRAALNVAALNCLKPEHAGILPAYKVLLTRNEDKLAATNKELRNAFKAIYGTTHRDVMDDYLTQVYNYFALPPVQKAFCDVSLDIANESLLVQPSGLDAFAARSMPRIEAVFEDFFRAYEDYLEELAKWNSLYGEPTVTVYASGVPFNNPLAPEFTYRPTIPAASATQQTVIQLPGATTAPPPGPSIRLPNADVVGPVEQATVGPPAGPEPSIQLPAASLPGASAPVSGPVLQLPSDVPAPDPETTKTTGDVYGPKADPDDGER